jgi:hypothetical protein
VAKNKAVGELMIALFLSGIALDLIKNIENIENVY